MKDSVKHTEYTSRLTLGTRKSTDGKSLFCGTGCPRYPTKTPEIGGLCQMNMTQLLEVLNTVFTNRNLQLKEK